MRRAYAPFPLVQRAFLNPCCCKMSYNKVSPILNTLSSARPRELPKNFGELTLKAVERGKFRGPHGRNETSDILNQLASRPPSSPETESLFERLRRKSESTSSATPANGSLEKRLTSTRVRFSVPDPRRPTMGGASQSPYIRPVSRLDQLAAQTGIDSSAASVRPRRTYKDRFEARPQTDDARTTTRFSLPRRSATGRSRSGAPRRAATPGQTKERRLSRAQEAESSRKAAIAARKSAPAPEPVAYTYAGIDGADFSPILQRLYATGSKSTYRAHQAKLHDSRDATRLVVGNRSIVRKQTVLDKIGAWIPAEKDVARI